MFDLIYTKYQAIGLVKDVVTVPIALNSTFLWSVNSEKNSVERGQCFIEDRLSNIPFVTSLCVLLAIWHVISTSSKSSSHNAMAC